MRLFFLAIGIGIFISVPNLFADGSGNAGSLSLLTDKEDNQIEARILSISPNRKMLRIERSDNRMFEVEIVTLSLDSQQAVKNWLTAQPGASESLNLELTAQRADGESTREKLESPTHRATWEQQRMGFRLAVINRTAEEANHLTLDYCLLLQDLVSVRSDANLTEDNPVRWRIRTAGEIRYFRGSIELPSLRFNDEELIDTATMTCDSVRVSGGARENGEDQPIGIIARVTDIHGRTVAEFSDLRRDFADISWENIEARFDPQETDGIGMLVEQMVSR